MSNKITKWAWDALVVYGIVERISAVEGLKGKLLKEIGEVVRKVNDNMCIKVKSTSKLYIHKTESGWILYRGPQVHGDEKKYQFV
jgi:hypothetical protein